MNYNDLNARLDKNHRNLKFSNFVQFRKSLLKESYFSAPQY